MRRAEVPDSAEAARMLHDFNTEFGEESAGPEVYGRRLSALLATDTTLCFLVGSEPLAAPIGMALVALRPNHWYDTPIALLDELYVIPARRNQGAGSALLTGFVEFVRGLGVRYISINVDGGDTDARRFYERHGFACQYGNPPQTELCYSREFDPL